MIVASYSEARNRLGTLLDQATDDLEEIVIQRRGRPDAVLVSADEYRSLKETAHLLSSRTTAERLQQAIAQADRGEGVIVSDDDLEAIRREIEEMSDGASGGESPTLARLRRRTENGTARA